MLLFLYKNSVFGKLFVILSVSPNSLTVSNCVHVIFEINAIFILSVNRRTEDTYIGRDDFCFLLGKMF